MPTLKDNIEVATVIKSKIREAQCKELTEHHIYKELSRLTGDKHNKEVLDKIAADELEDYQLWRSYTNEEACPQRFKVLQFTFIARLFGITFAIKLLERDSQRILEAFEFLSKSIPDGKSIINARFAREKELIGLIDEERLKYIGAVVLGLSDALVELTGVLAGFTLALQNTRIILVAGLITGIAASLSMGASVYLSAESEKTSLNPLKSAFYTSIAYLLTVLFLVYPFLIFQNPFISLALTICDAILTILLFAFYSSVVQDAPFGARFRRMAFISLGVAALTFGIGFAVWKMFNISI
jgi:VIT1/CCC1 family predicted Fe2+/Mn2+ transporter